MGLRRLVGQTAFRTAVYDNAGHPVDSSERELGDGIIMSDAR